VVPSSSNAFDEKGDLKDQKLHNDLKNAILNSIN